MSIASELSKFFITPLSKMHKGNKKKIESDNSYCYSNIIWNTKNNLIILISFTENYFEQIIEIQDAINCTNLCSKIVYSSYDEKTDKKDEDGDDVWIIHKKYYLLIGGDTISWQELYMNIHDLGNEVLSKITDEILNNCNSAHFKKLLNDGILHGFTEHPNEDTPVEAITGHTYTNPEVLIKYLPNGFTGKDIIKFIKIYDKNGVFRSTAYSEILNINFSNYELANYEFYPLYAALFKNPTIEGLKMVLEPLYKQPDDDSIPGDVSDESLDEIFRERYERFSAISDDNIHYEDIDEELLDDEEY